MNSRARVLTRAMTSAGLAALGWSAVAQAQTPTVFNACVTPLTGLLYQPKEPGKCFLPSHRAISWTDGLGAFFGATTLGGDLSGTLPRPMATGLRGHPVSPTNPTAGQILIWDGSVWTPGNQVGGSSGTAGGALTGTYPNPGLADGAVTTASLANEAVTEAKLAFDPVTQVELDLATAAAASADATLQININAVSDALTTHRNLIGSSGGTANSAGNPVSWSQLKDIPSAVISGSGGGGANGISGWERVVETVAVPPFTDGTVTITALCPTGKKAIGGGYEAPLTGTPTFIGPIDVVATRPTSDGAGWEVVATHPATHGSAPGIAYAVCANAAP